MIYSITEGQQAEEYKARKAAEEAEKNKENSRYSKFPNKVYGIDIKHYSPSINADIAKATDIAQNAINKRIIKGKKYDSHDQFQSDMHTALDTTLRHMRRHPNQYKESCSIFSSVAFI